MRRHDTVCSSISGDTASAVFTYEDGPGTVASSAGRQMLSRPQRPAVDAGTQNHECRLMAQLLRTRLQAGLDDGPRRRPSGRSTPCNVRRSLLRGAPTK